MDNLKLYTSDSNPKMSTKVMNQEKNQVQNYLELHTQVTSREKKNIRSKFGAKGYNSRESAHTLIFLDKF